MPSFASYSSCLSRVGAQLQQLLSAPVLPGCLIEACEYGLTRGTCFVARRLEVVAVAGLL